MYSPPFAPLLPLRLDKIIMINISVDILLPFTMLCPQAPSAGNEARPSKTELIPAFHRSVVVDEDEVEDGGAETWVVVVVMRRSGDEGEGSRMERSERQFSTALVRGARRKSHNSRRAKINSPSLGAK
jgi:hypothetical protein